MLGWPWPNVTIWLCIGTATATVLTVLLNRHIRAHGETWSRTRKLNMTILDLTIVFMWPGFYVYKNTDIGTAGRTRTDTRLPPLDFESSVSTIPPQRLK
jgi:hypothetical protein